MSNEKELSICGFCGQHFECPEGENPDEYALEHCSCGDARSYRDKQNRIEEAKLNLSEIFGYQLTIGETPQNDESIEKIRKNLEAFIPLIIDLDINSITANISNFGKVTLSATSDGSIKMKRTAGNTIERKV